MKKNYIVLAILIVLVGYQLWHKSPQEKAEKVIKNWMEHSYGDDYKTANISSIDTLNYSREIIRNMEFCREEIETADNTLRDYSKESFEKEKELTQIMYKEMYKENKAAADEWLKIRLDLEERIEKEHENLKRLRAESLNKYNSLKNSKQFLGYSVRHTYEAKGEEYNVFFLLDKDLTHVTDTIHFNYSSMRYLGAFKEIWK